MKISCLTVSQLSRFETLQLLAQQLEEQTWRQYIIEWIIVEGSKTQEDAELNKLNIKHNLKTTLNIKYVEWKENQKLGKLRNLANDAVDRNTDFVAWFDDDDYYYPERLEYSITELQKSECKIAGCKQVFIYDWYLKQLFQTDEEPHFSSNGTMIYKAEYLKNHRYNNDLQTGEETQFLNEFKEPVLQLDSNKVCFMNSHSLNTYNKREILIHALYGLHKFIKPWLTKYNAPRIPNHYFEEYKKILYKTEKSEYDIVYLCGYIGIDWTPNDTSLGGSEQAIVELCENWKKLKPHLKICVYGKVPEITHNGVDYKPMSHFNHQNEYKTVIAWRSCGLMAIANVDLRCECLIADLHDNEKVSQLLQITQQQIQKCNYVHCKSQFHKKELLEVCNVDESKIRIIENGVKDMFMKRTLPLIKQTNRFCYCSCYSRGLVEILIFIWTKIIETDPTAEMHLYYGKDFLTPEQLKNFNEVLVKCKNVMDHGRCSSDLIKREKEMSQFQLYITQSPLEIDCISIKESYGLGCIPLISNSGVFEEREGIHFNINNNAQSYLKAGDEIVKIMKDYDTISKYQKHLQNFPFKNWNSIAKIWLNYF